MVDGWWLMKHFLLFVSHQPLTNRHGISTNWRMRDVNLELASLLYDMAAIAGDTQRAWGYKRAAKAVLRIDRDITPLITANTFKAISGIGPTTDRIARELIRRRPLRVRRTRRAGVGQGTGDCAPAQPAAAVSQPRRRQARSCRARGRRRARGIEATSRCTRSAATARRRWSRS